MIWKETKISSISNKEGYNQKCLHGWTPPQKHVKIWRFCHLGEATLWQYPRSVTCDVTISSFNFWTFPNFLQRSDCGGKAAQASIAGSSLDIKQARYTVASMHVQDQYPAGKWILFHTYYWARRDRMPLQSTLVFLSGRCVAESHETAPQLNNSTIEFDWSFFTAVAFTSSLTEALNMQALRNRKVKTLTLFTVQWIFHTYWVHFGRDLDGN